MSELSPHERLEKIAAIVERATARPGVTYMDEAEMLGIYLLATSRARGVSAPSKEEPTNER